MEENDIPGSWWTAPAESDSGDLIMVTGRSDVDKFRKNPRFNIRVEIAWKYAESGMPDEKSDVAAMMGQIDERFHRVFKADPIAVLTGIFTGDGERTWVFYTLSTYIFQKKLNEALEDLPLLPLKITAEKDPEWLAYDEMLECMID